MKLWKKVVVGLTLCALPCAAYAYGTQVQGQFYACAGKSSKSGKVFKTKICTTGLGDAMTIFVARWQDWRRGEDFTCKPTNKACVFEQ